MGIGRKPQGASDFRSVTVLRDGGGDFPTIDSALEYLAGSGFTPTNDDYFSINIGVGTFTVDNSAGPLILPDFVVLQGEGFSVTNVRGNTPANDLFQFDSCTARNISFGNCAICLDRIPATNGAIYIDQCEFASCVSGIRSGAGFNFVQRCTAQNWTGTLIQANGGIVFAVENCNFVLPANNAEFFVVTGGQFSLRSCTMEGSVATGTRGIFANQSSVNATCDISGNNWNRIETAIQIGDQANMTFFSKDDKIRSSTNDLIIDGAGGTNSSMYIFSDLTANPDNFVLNGNTPPLNFINDADSTLTAAVQVKTVTTNTTLDQTYTNVLCDNVNDFTVTLPDVSQYTNWVYTIKNISTNLVTIATTGADTIDNEVTEIVGQYEAIKIVSDGTNWWVI